MGGTVTVQEVRAYLDGLKFPKMLSKQVKWLELEVYSTIFLFSIFLPPLYLGYLNELKNGLEMRMKSQTILIRESQGDWTVGQTAAIVNGRW